MKKLIVLALLLVGTTIIAQERIRKHYESLQLDTSNLKVDINELIAIEPAE